MQHAEEQRAARQTWLRSGRSYGNLSSRTGRLDSTDNAASKTAMSHASSSTDLACAEAAARQGGASPFKVREGGWAGERAKLRVRMLQGKAEHRYHHPR